MIASLLSLALMSAQPALIAEQVEPIPLTPSSDALDALDLGVARLSDGQVEEWEELEGSELELGAETVVVGRGDTVDRLLLRRGIRPDPYSRGLIAELNPSLDESLTLSEAQSVTLPVLLSARDADGLVALQPHRSDRQNLEAEAQSAYATMQAQIGEAQGEEQAQLEDALRRLERAERETVRTNAAQIAADTSALRSFNDLLGDASVRFDHQAVAAAANETADILQHHAVNAGSLTVVALSTETTVTGVCEVAWSVAGFSALPGSVSYTDFPAPRPIAVPVSHLDVWVTRERRPISDSRYRVNKNQLTQGAGHRLTVSVGEACGS